MNNKKPKVRINTLSQAKLIRALLDGDMTYYELAEETGLNYNSIRLYCRALHREGAVYIADWRPDVRGAMTLAVPKIGTRKDVPKPVKLASQRAREYRARRAAQKMIQLTAGALR